MLITVMLLAMIAGLAVGLVASFAHLKHGPAARRARVQSPAAKAHAEAL